MGDIWVQSFRPRRRIFLTGGAPTRIHQGEALADAAAAAAAVEAEAEVEAESMGEVRVGSGTALGPEDQ